MPWWPGNRSWVEVEKLVRGARVVTLCGAGGSGKTRLGLQAAAGLVDEFPDGVFEDGHFWENAVGRIKLTGPDGEGPVHVTFAGPHEGNLVSESFDPATGLLTLVFTDKFLGKPVQVRIPGTGVVVIDSGFISWTVTVVIDTTTDELVSEEFTDVVIRGPHPFFENEFSLTAEQLAAVCDALGA